MKIIRMTLAGLYVIVAKGLASSASEAAAGPRPVKGTPIKCTGKGEFTSNVTQPNTTVTVTCSGTFKYKPPAGDENDVYSDKKCTTPVALSSLCPGASVANPGAARGLETEVTVRFPQLPTTQQVVYLKCEQDPSNVCVAIIAVAPASPQGPQACAVRGRSVTLQVDQAGGSAEFACGEQLTLAPSDPKEAYAEDCSKVETLKDMTRSDKLGDYSTLKVNKLKKKKLCYVCGQSGHPGKQVGEGDRCTIYVDVSGTRRFSTSVFFGFTLPCLAAMLGFT